MDTDTGVKTKKPRKKKEYKPLFAVTYHDFSRKPIYRYYTCTWWPGYWFEFDPELGYWGA
jgi:hypothetical protein